MLEGPPEVLVREYRGYRYVAEDLFTDDAADLDAEGWDVHSSSWEEETGQALTWALFAAGIFTGSGPKPPVTEASGQRREYVLTVTYHRQPGWDG